MLIPEEDLLSFFRIDRLRKKVLKETEATDHDQDEESEMVHQIKCEIINEEWQEEKETLLKKIETLENDKSRLKEDLTKKSSEHDALDVKLHESSETVSSLTREVDKLQLSNELVEMKERMRTEERDA